MKDFVKFIGAMILTMAMLLAAARGYAYGEEGLAKAVAWRVDKEGETVEYFVSYKTDTGSVQEFRVGEYEFAEAVSIVQAAEAEAYRQRQIDEYKAGRNWIQKVGGFLSFWNPDD